MRVSIPGGARQGRVRAPASKSAAQRLLLCAALSESGCTLSCDGISRDLAAMIECLRALGASIRVEGASIRVEPVRAAAEGESLLPCCESGATLRFLLPVVGALGASARFVCAGRLPDRPLAPLSAELVRHGMAIETEGAELRVSGRLRGGDWALPGDVSSQFVSALLMALPLLEEDSRLTLTAPLQSAPYVALTEQTLRQSALRLERDGESWLIPGGQRPAPPSALTVEGDWSNAAVFLAVGALSDGGVAVEGLDMASVQGDRAVLELLARFGASLEQTEGSVRAARGTLRGVTIDAAQIPDLVPPLAALGALAEGETRIVNAARLRLKESDRLRGLAAMLGALGAELRELPDGLVIRGRPSLRGGSADCLADHRLAMAAAVAACGCTDAVELDAAECVEKSYPRFWDDFGSLGGL